MTKAAKPERTRTSTRKAKTQTDAGSDAGAMAHDRAPSETPSNTPAAQTTSKTGRVINLLQRQGGASLDELVVETGWQPHTTRAVLTGLRKKGHAISSDKVDGVRRYHAAAVQ